jgi:hypothetical protein
MRLHSGPSPLLVYFFFGIAAFRPAFAQADKCPAGSKFVGNIEAEGSFNKNLNSHREVALPEGTILDSTKQQTALKPAGGGSDSRSDMPASSIPAGIFIVPYGSEDHEKGWAIHSPTLVAATGIRNEIKQFKFGLTLYCTTGSGEIDRFVGPCYVRVTVCIFEAKSVPNKKADTRSDQKPKPSN